MTKAGMLIHPIRTEQDHRAAVARIEVLIGAAPDTPEGDELDVLATLVDAYEAKHHPIDPPDPIAVIQFRMDQQQLTRKDLEPLIGSRARVSEVLTGKRPLTLAMIRRLSSRLGIPTDVLIGAVPAPGKTHSATRTRSVRETSKARGARVVRAN